MQAVENASIAQRPRKIQPHCHARPCKLHVGTWRTWSLIKERGSTSLSHNRGGPSDLRRKVRFIWGQRSKVTGKPQSELSGTRWLWCALMSDALELVMRVATPTRGGDRQGPHWRPRQHPLCHSATEWRYLPFSNHLFAFDVFCLFSERWKLCWLIQSKCVLLV